MRTETKIVLLGLLTLSALAINIDIARAQYPYDEEVYVYYHLPYDPYYELHVIHYQLYLKPNYPYYYQYYPLSPVQVFVIGGQPGEVRRGQPARKR